MNTEPFSQSEDPAAQLTRPKIIAHRGASRSAPENTMAAIEKALELGAEGIEIDVQLTSDKVPVITHNDDLSILTHHRGYVHATPFETVRSIDVGSHFSAGTAGMVMPTLPEVLEYCSRHDIITVVEIKAQPGMISAAAQLVGGIISDISMRGPIMISSASLRILHKLSQYHPDIPRALVRSLPHFPFFPTVLFARWNKLKGFHPSVRALRPQHVSRMQRLGCEVFAWTVNDQDAFNTCLACDVDGIFTDDIPFAKASREHYRRAARSSYEQQ